MVLCCAKDSENQRPGQSKAGPSLLVPFLQHAMHNVQCDEMIVNVEFNSFSVH